jgi:uncharacterized MnhB-related membrane protein
MLYVVLVIATIILAIQAIRARRLIICALYLAGVSALLSIVFYLMGAHMVAVIELSVGAGLVTVLFVYAINIAGEGGLEMSPLINRWFAGGLAVFAIVLLGWYVLPITAKHPPLSEPALTYVIWQERALDVFVQVVLIFAGVLGLLGLLAESKAPLKYPVAKEVAARREKELDTLTQQTIERETT